MALTSNQDQIQVFIDYKSNLDENIKKSKAALGELDKEIKTMQKQISQNAKFISDREGKTHKATLAAVQKRRLENTKLQKIVREQSLSLQNQQKQLNTITAAEKRRVQQTKNLVAHQTTLNKRHVDELNVMNKFYKAQEVAESTRKAQHKQALRDNLDEIKADNLKNRLKGSNAKVFFAKQRVLVLNAQRLEANTLKQKQRQIALEKEKAAAMAKTAKQTEKILKAEQKITENAKKAKDKAKRREHERSFAGALDQSVGTTFGHKFATTAQYAASGIIIGGAFAAVAAGATAAVTALASFDLQARTTAAVLDLSLKQSRALSHELLELSTQYGGTIDSINAVALSLGRAGISSNKLVKSTEIVIKMARLTGDTFEESANAMISFQQVFGDTNSLEQLGDKLAFVANVSRLSTKDIGTFANFALAAAKNVGLSVDAVGGLAAAFSNAGVNASTIGTQIRRFTSLLSDNATSVVDFFNGIGVTQGNLLSDLQSDVDTSNAAFLEFVDTIAELDDAEFNRLTGSMDILARNSLSLMRNNSTNLKRFVTETANGVEGQLKSTDVILRSYTVSWESLINELFSTIIKMGETSTVKTSLGFLTNILTTAGAVTSFISGDTKGAQDSIMVINLRSLAKQLEETSDVIERTKIEAEMISLEKAIKGEATPDSTREDLTAKINKLANALGSKAFTDDQIPVAEKNLINYTKALEDFNREADKTAKNLDKQPITVSASDTAARANLLSTQADSGILQAEAVTSLEIQTKEIIKNKQKDINKLLATENISRLKGVTSEQMRSDILERRAIILEENARLDVKTDQAKIKANNDQLTTYGQILPILDTIATEEKKITQVKEAHTKQEELKLDLSQKLKLSRDKLNGVDVSALTLAEITLVNKQQQLDAAKGTRLEAQKEIERNEAALVVKKLINKEEDKTTKEKAKQVKLDEKAEELRKKFLEDVRKLNNKDFSGVPLTRSERIDELQREFDFQKQRAGDERLTLEEQRAAHLQALELSKKLEVQQLRLNDAWRVGATDGLKRWLVEAEDVYSQVSSLTASAMSQMTGAFIDFVTTGKASFSDMTRSILSDILKIMIRKQIAGLVGSLFFPTAGAQIGTTAGAMTAPSFAFAANGGFLPDVPRRKNFASGGLLSGGSGTRDDLYLGTVDNTAMFAMGGEFITQQSSVNPRTRAGLEFINKTGRMPESTSAVSVAVSSPVTVNIENQSGQDIEAEMIQEMTKTNERGEEEKIVNIILKRARTDLGFRNALKGR